MPPILILKKVLDLFFHFVKKLQLCVTEFPPPKALYCLSQDSRQSERQPALFLFYAQEVQLQIWAGYRVAWLLNSKIILHSDYRKLDCGFNCWLALSQSHLIHAWLTSCFDSTSLFRRRSVTYEEVSVVMVN